MNWFQDSEKNKNGGILVLPTGGGKTFTAIRFLCQGPLSEGYKVLWLAHTHHLLEQAYYSFGPRSIDQERGYEIGYIREPKENLNIRVVSGTRNHFRIQQIDSKDDVVISTLQSMSSGYKKNQPNLMKFLDSAGEKLFVVFDEAHHSPAPSYRNFILSLQERFSKMFLLGLTATPTYSNKKKKGWLRELYPQGILSQVSINDLMANDILAEPLFEEPETQYKPKFDEREYNKWVNSNQGDLPNYIIKQLAKNKDRNQFIANVYAENRDKFKKTLIFADRKEQCIQLVEFLKQKGVKAGFMFSGIFKYESGRTIGSDNDNSIVLEKFRKGDIDVIVNIRMLTEGTDVPNISSIFLTRQTTSKILLTQMIGRGLRGSNFGGTDKAHIVSFIDDWKQMINWAEWDPIQETEVEPEPEVPVRSKTDWQLISIDLIRHISRLMSNNNGIETGPFLKSVPLGWYQTNYYAVSAEGDDYNLLSRLVMVFEDEKIHYNSLMEHLQQIDLTPFEDEKVSINQQKANIENWSQNFFKGHDSIGGDLENNIFYIACHIAQNDNEKPQFFAFQERKNHDMDSLARKFMKLKVDDFEKDEMLMEEFERPNRYWKTIYPNYEQFSQQYHACIRRLLLIQRDNKLLDKPYKKTGTVTEGLEEKLRKKVKNRDKNHCLCCGETNLRLLDVDHINPRYYGGLDSIDNLQTLCNRCNRLKNVKEIDFREKISHLPSPPPELSKFKFPNLELARDTDEWVKFIKRTLNLFYCSQAVKTVDISNDKEWKIVLYSGINREWVKPFLNEFLSYIMAIRNQGGYEGPEKLTIN